MFQVDLTLASATDTRGKWLAFLKATRNIFKKDIRRREDDDFMIEKLYNGYKTFIFHQIHVQYN